MSNVIVYSTDPCPYCSMAKALLDKRGVAYEEITLARDPAGRDQLIEKTGMYTFPQVLIDGTLIGGFTELKAADKSGQLKQLLAEAA
ncbi:MAG: glutaredoxin [Solirubrobacterales bacterium]|jgi:glutaredoxin 3|nr:glutaredoxin [Solirubrobacterales bacterium]